MFNLITLAIFLAITTLTFRPRFYHLMGHEAGVEHVEEFGAVHGGAGVRISFNLFSAAHQRREVLRSVLASFEWR